ncbi:glutamine--fructose-6-phosphate transaminase (isomerizing) [Helicovermis profundi]|uniref:Glutamine--fructose-6-phosphate aminotransferase [isomerizing] n=1 Tax=Helicovermis profundi TaxID=3065157 RepID=A0AAU9E2S0_9FIRM|nr:glutamine--fructose-6-phosphate transaminase (isomerizing) [Clostridia bacterium S502]
MCGIVGYIGDKQAIPVLINGLSKLEYRGYDSAGVAYFSENKIVVNKEKGRLSVLSNKLNGMDIKTNIGIGHTRWATHGEPNVLNAHPHINGDSSIAVIHNGIIENYLKLKEWMIEEYGTDFKSETDTEVIAHLIGYFYDGDILEAVNKAIDKMEGAYAIGVICSKEPDRIIAVRKDSPLIVGVGEGENFIASDIPAILNYTRNVYLIENDEVVELTKNEVKIYDKFGQIVNREIYKVTWDASSAEKEGFEHFTLKEIYEQPKCVEETVSRRLDNDDYINLDGIKISKKDIENINKIYIIACGTAYHAGLVGKYAIEKILKIPVVTEVASEFRYSDPIVDENTLFIAVSQSGETLDTLAALREAKRKGARILSVVNVVGSSVARESDDVFYTWAGPEIGVASTKAYTTQLAAFYLLSLYMGKVSEKISDDEYFKILNELKTMPNKVKETLDSSEVSKQLAAEQFNNESVFFMGRGLDVYTAYEGSLKFKEISYVNSFAIPAGELKHGTIALIEKNTLVIAIANQENLFQKILSNIKEVKARGAYVVAIAQEGHKEIEKVADKVIWIPKTLDLLTPILGIIPLQLFAYYVSLAKGNDVDKPRNLAKSVTVE